MTQVGGLETARTRGRTPRVRTGVRRIADTRGDRAVGVTAYVILGAFTLSVIYPLIYVLSSSFSSATAINRGDVILWPVGFNIDAYATILSSHFLVSGFANSVLYAVAGAVIGTITTVLAGYALSRDDLPYRRVLTFVFLLPTLVSAGIIPTYMVVRQLGLLDTRWAVILPGAMSIFNMLITRTFYQATIPKELLEAATVDGATDFSFLWKIAVPLSKPIIAVNLLFYGVGQWNGWFNAFLYLSDSDKYPLQLVLREILAQNTVDPSQMGGGDLTEILKRRELFDRLKYAVIVVAMVPPLIAYPFVQKHFVRGIMIGSIK